MFKPAKNLVCFLGIGVREVGYSVRLNGYLIDFRQFYEELWRHHMYALGGAAITGQILKNGCFKIKRQSGKISIKTEKAEDRFIFIGRLGKSAKTDYLR